MTAVKKCSFGITTVDGRSTWHRNNVWQTVPVKGHRPRGWESLGGYATRKGWAVNGLGTDSSSVYHRHQRARSTQTAFTLVELLVVIAILGILASLLMPALSKSKDKAVRVVDINNLKQQTLALHIYVADSLDALPWPNWLAGDPARGAGWLYTINTNASGPEQFKVQTGAFWKTLGNPRLYMCPADNTNVPLFSLRGQRISSYVMNGAVVGYERLDNPTVRMAAMSPQAVAFWETDEEEPGFFNDGASFPKEGVSAI